VLAPSRMSQYAWIAPWGRSWTRGKAPRADGHHRHRRRRDDDVHPHAAVILGLGTAAVIPSLIAQVSDLVTPRDRASGVGVHHLWRDLGYVAGGLLAGVLADLLGYRAAI
jgi:hypothetical protein